MKRIGFIGLGLMGKPMALNLLKAGYPMTVYDLRSEPVQELVSAGATAASSSKEVAERSDVVITMVTSSPNVQEIMYGDNGVFAGAKPGTILIDMSTIDPIVTREIAEAAAERGLRMMDAPVSGAPPKAAAGTLSIMVGADKDLFDECLPLLQAMGEKIVHCGGIGMGEVVKLANNLAASIQMIGVIEGFLFGTKLGADPKTLYEVMASSSANCWALQTRVPYPGVIPDSPANSDFAPGFTTDLMAKDLGLIQSAAKSVDVPLIMGNTVAQLVTAAKARGYGSKDWSVVAKVIQSLAEKEG
ncbi:MAG TPA: 3-hydroxyisobutyrate dehydrogenase [Dehalococcoidia bacterium]|jgi:3-hydroxyisobutyrate dehydrogenase|nr:3-hydroxyisobutyrate dehydrogenase [Dehalococcoidia bacterium]